RLLQPRRPRPRSPRSAAETRRLPRSPSFRVSSTIAGCKISGQETVRLFFADAEQILPTLQNDHPVRHRRGRRTVITQFVLREQLEFRTSLHYIRRAGAGIVDAPFRRDKGTGMRRPAGFEKFFAVYFSPGREIETFELLEQPIQSPVGNERRIE